MVIGIEMTMAESGRFTSQIVVPKTSRISAPPRQPFPSIRCLIAFVYGGPNSSGPRARSTPDTARRATRALGLDATYADQIRLACARTWLRHPSQIHG